MTEILRSTPMTTNHGDGGHAGARLTAAQRRELKGAARAKSQGRTYSPGNGRVAANRCVDKGLLVTDGLNYAITRTGLAAIDRYPRRCLCGDPDPQHRHFGITGGQDFPPADCICYDSEPEPNCPVHAALDAPEREPAEVAAIPLAVLRRWCRTLYPAEIVRQSLLSNVFDEEQRKVMSDEIGKKLREVQGEMSTYYNEAVAKNAESKVCICGNGCDTREECDQYLPMMDVPQTEQEEFERDREREPR